MDTLRWILGVLALLVLLAWLAGRFGALRGHQPADIGVREGRLKPPSRTPNSVSSQADLYPEHPMREYAHIAALPGSGGASASIARVRAVVERMPGAMVAEQRDDYLYAQFETPALRFIDDVEFWFDPAAQTIAVGGGAGRGRPDGGGEPARREGRPPPVQD